MKRISRMTGTGQNASMDSNGQRKLLLLAGNKRQVSLAIGPQQKYQLLGKIVSFLKNCFLSGKCRRPTLDQLLDQIQECQVSDRVKEWLETTGFVNHPRIRILPGDVPRYGYETPYPNKRCSSPVALLAHLKTLYESENEAKGILRSYVEDSSSIGKIVIEKLLEEKKIIEVTCAANTRVLHYNPNHPKLSQLPAVDPRFQGLWRRVDVANRDMSQIKQTLAVKGLLVQDSETTRMSSSGCGLVASRNRQTDTESVPVRKTRSSTANKFRDNSHVADLIVYNDPSQSQIMNQ